MAPKHKRRKINWNPFPGHPQDLYLYTGGTWDVFIPHFVASGLLDHGIATPNELRRVKGFV